VGSETESFRFESRTNLSVIEDLTVENDHNIAVRAEERLIAAFQIENTKPGGTQRDLV
jgi:hypothetical protein